MAKPIAPAAIPRKAFWWNLANSVIRKVKTGGKKGKGAEGSFRKYSASYRIAKAKGRFKRQSSTSTSPDLTLTDDMWQDFQIIKVNWRGALIGWTSEGDKVSWNEDMGRAISTDANPVAPKIQDYIMKQIDIQYEKNLNKVADTTTIEVGK